MGFGKIIWLFYGQWIRYKESGKMCAGEHFVDDGLKAPNGYLPTTGKVMVTWIFMEYGICVFCFLIACMSERRTSID
jgi:hypothetical protein